MALATEKRFKCEILTWNSIARDAKRLSRMIRDSGYDPHIVVAIGRGGLVPARILCDYLHIKDLTTIKVEHWGIAATPDEKAAVKFPLCADIENQRVLLVDDTTDTGDTLKVSLEYLREFGPGEIKTAVLLHKTTSDIVPDYFVRKIIKWRWVIFPWHLWEDLTVFVRDIKDMGIASEEAVRTELRSAYCLDIQIETIREILSELE